MKIRPWQRCVAAIITFCFFLTGCVSLQGVPMPPPGQKPAVEVGEKVEVTTRDSRTLRFKVTAVEPDALVGKDVRVGYSEITSLQAERADAAQTGLIVWIVLGIVAVVAVAAIYADESTYYCCEN